MSTAAQTPGDRACRYATSAETVMRAYATEAMGDLASGLEMLAQEAAAALIVAVEGESMDALEEASLRYCKANANAIIGAIAHESDNDLLLAAEALMEAAKLMLDAEFDRRMQAQSAPS